MAPRLIGIRGLFRGISVLLQSEGLSMGRGSTNPVKLEDLLVSRRHCRITAQAGGHWLLEDLESANGTFVNGVREKTKVLQPGDTIEVGESSFLYLEDEAEGPDCVEWEEGERPAEETMRYAAARPGAAIWEDREERDLRVMLALAGALPATTGLEALLRQLLEKALSGMGASRGAVVLAGDGPEDCEFTYGLKRDEKPALRVSRALLRRMNEEKRAVLWRREEASELEAESLRGSAARSVASAPMIVRGRVTGALYIESDGRMSDRDLELVAGLASIAAQPIDVARRLDRLEGENRRLRAESGRDLGMIGDSPAMQRVYDAVARIAPADASVLILGESGTGKELAARAIHDNGRRARGPFVAVNCAAIAEGLMESEFFGHERGAFTGAVTQKRGKLETAGGGTLFLDEVGELPLTLQAKLLRVLQEREFERVGGTRPIRVDVRVVAATNRNLSELVAEGRFRSDLYYRLNVVSLRMPALRERGEDVLLLAGEFLARIAATARRPLNGLSQKARMALLRHDWPGNVRELQNAIERGVVLGSSEWLELEDLPAEIAEGVPSQDGEQPAGYHWVVREAKRRCLEAAMRESGGRHVEAARQLGINVKYLHRLLRTYGLK